jgi:hypothetical protein
MQRQKWRIGWEKEKRERIGRKQAIRQIHCNTGTSNPGCGDINREVNNVIMAIKMSWYYDRPHFIALQCMHKFDWNISQHRTLMSLSLSLSLSLCDKSFLILRMLGDRLQCSTWCITATFNCSFLAANLCGVYHKICMIIRLSLFLIRPTFYVLSNIRPGKGSWLWHYAISRKVAGSIPDEIIAFFFSLPNPSSRTTVLGSTQPLTEMSIRNLPEG